MRTIDIDTMLKQSNATVMQVTLSLPHSNFSRVEKVAKNLARARKQPIPGTLTTKSLLEIVSLGCQNAAQQIKGTKEVFYRLELQHRLDYTVDVVGIKVHLEASTESLGELLKSLRESQPQQLRFQYMHRQSVLTLSALLECVSIQLSNQPSVFELSEQDYEEVFVFDVIRY